MKFNFYFNNQTNFTRTMATKSVMGIKGRRVHMIEELSETIISFQRGKRCLANKQKITVIAICCL